MGCIRRLTDFMEGTVNFPSHVNHTMSAPRELNTNTWYVWLLGWTRRVAGTAFFCGPLEPKIWEIKRMADGGIVCVRFQLISDNFTEHRAYNVTCLDGLELKRSKLVLSGDFPYDSGERIHGIRPWRARPVSSRISVTGPFTVFMCRHMRSMPSSPRVPPAGRSRSRPPA